MAFQGITVVIPTYNEEGNIQPLVARLCSSLAGTDITYELIFVDDHSTDRTREEISRLDSLYPIRGFMKQGQKGKAYSLLEGFQYARYDLIAMIDADLQYPPEAIPQMIQKLGGGTDIVVANRKINNESYLRQILSKSFAFIFARLLHKLTCDVQSGLKVFRKKILSDIALNPTQWTFDMEFLLNARNCGYGIDSVEISFAERTSGESSIRVLQTIYEIGSNALALKFRGREPQLIRPEVNTLMVGAGVSHKNKRFVTHTTLPHDTSAITTFAPWQKILIYSVISVVILGLYHNPLQTGVIAMAVLSTIYFLDVLFNLFLIKKSLSQSSEIRFSQDELSALDDADLPMYTILCPLYKEANILPNFLESIAKLEWPKEKLDVLLLLEENDEETVQAARAMQLADYVRIIVVPHSMPKTKPKACNYGLAFAKGQYLVIYDAEDIPDPWQLKKAYYAYQNVPDDVVCLQAKLNYYNPHQNLLTRLFTAEYSLWFDMTLIGLQSLNTYIPLGGTSNHFKFKQLEELKGWDPFNVTEDCDLGIRLFRKKYKTAMIDSVTLEEANSRMLNWLRQRSRWLKGYMQTYLVHMRKPITFAREHGIHAVIFQLVVGGKIAFALINPFLWIATIAYFSLRSIVGPTIEALFPPIIFFMAAFSLVFGNFLFMYYYMIGCAKRKHWSLVKYVYFVPLYWLMTSVAAYFALYQLVVKPHYWEKTHHGLLVKQRFGDVIALSFKSFVARLRTAREIITAFKTPDSLMSGGSMLVIAMMISNFLNLLYNALLGRLLSFETLGLVTFMNTLWFLVAVFMNALAATINHRTAYLVAADQDATGIRFLKTTVKKALPLALAVTIGWILVTPWLSTFFKIETVLPLITFAPIIVFGVLVAANKGYLQGKLLFRAVGGVLLAEATSKLGIALLLIWSGNSSLAYASIPLSIVISAVVAIAIVQRNKEYSAESRTIRFPGRFYIGSLLLGLSTVVFLSLDMILVKHYLAVDAAGQYALLALVGKMIYFFGSLPIVFMLTLISRDTGLDHNPRMTFRLLYGLSVIFVAVATLALGPLGPFTVPLLLGEKAIAILPQLNLYVGALALFTLSSGLVTYHLAKKNYVFPIVSLGLSILMALGIVYYHASIGQIAQVIFTVSSFGLVLVTILHLAENQLKFVMRNLVDFFSAFAQLPMTEPELSSKRILIFNWRDTVHTFAGGAEKYVHEIARHWVKEGHRVTVFCGNDGQSERDDEIDGVRIVRRGGFYFVYVWAFVYYLLRFRGKFDIIIDSHNGIPFFAPLFSTKPVYCLMHHVHQEVFRRSLSKPLALFAQFLEKVLMPLVYRHVPFITVSESSKHAMKAIGLGQAGISVVYPGVNLDQLAPGAKSNHPVVLYLGRLKEYKSVHVLIKAFHDVIQKIPDAELIIAGSGEEEAQLKKITRSLDLSGHVRFVGHVTEREKLRLYQRAWVLVNPSFMEGWGITTIEANACGTPVVASDVSGLRDSVVHQDTGYLVEYGNSEEFSRQICRLITNSTLRLTMMKKAVAWSQNFDWVKMSSDFLVALRTPSLQTSSVGAVVRMIGSVLIASALIFSTYSVLAKDTPDSVVNTSLLERVMVRPASAEARQHREILKKASVRKLTTNQQYGEIEDFVHVASITESTDKEAYE